MIGAGEGIVSLCITVLFCNIVYHPRIDIALNWGVVSGISAVGYFLTTSITVVIFSSCPIDELDFETGSNRPPLCSWTILDHGWVSKYLMDLDGSWWILMDLDGSWWILRLWGLWNCLSRFNLGRPPFPTTWSVTADQIDPSCWAGSSQDIFVSSRPAVCLALGFVSALPSGCLVVEMGLKGELSLLSRWDSKVAGSVVWTS